MEEDSDGGREGEGLGETEGDGRREGETGNMLARHRQASAGGKAERLVTCWLGTGRPRQAAKLKDW
jgi:hypothetical protein